MAQFIEVVLDRCRYLARYALFRFHDFYSHKLAQDLDYELYLRSRQESADFYLAHLKGTQRFTRDIDHLRHAFDLRPKIPNALLLQFGVYLARTMNFMARRTDERIFGFDSFEGLPESWGFNRLSAGAFKIQELPKVRPNVTLIKGYFSETLRPFLEAEKRPISFLHMDCDLYSSTVTVLEECRPYLAPGCIIVFDEYFNYPDWKNGEYRAFAEFCDKYGITFEYISYCSKHEQVAVRLNK